MFSEYQTSVTQSQEREAYEYFDEFGRSEGSRKSSSSSMDAFCRSLVM